MSKNPMTFSDIIKFNPYHGPDGRFTGPGAATSFTYRPGASVAHDRAIAREKERTKNMTAAGGGSVASKYGLTDEQLETLNNSGAISWRQKAREMGMSAEMQSKFYEEHLRDHFKDRAKKREQAEREEQDRKKAELDERVKNELPGLNQETIRRANNVSFFDHGSVAAREALKRVDDYKERNKIDDNWTDEQKAYAKQREEEYKRLITEYYNDSNSRFANNPHSMITGPARFNTRAYDNKMNAARNKEQEYEEKLSRFEENTKRQLERMTPADQQIARWRQGKWGYGESISADDPLATKKLQAKLEYLKENHENMKAANRAARSSGEKPHPTWELSNSNQQIKATESRLKQLERQASQRSSGGSASGSVSFNGGTMKHNADINRLQLVFDGKPSAEVRAQLKANGFRWSPSQGAWQRQDTPNAQYAADRILQSLNKSAEPTIGKSLSFRDALCIQSTIGKVQNTKNTLFIGLRVAGVPSDIMIDGGEDPEDMHVTLLYGYFDPRSDEEDTTVRVQSAIDNIKPLLPDSLRFDRIDRFPASESSDGKDVIYARVAAGQLEKAHEALLRELKGRGIQVEKTFSEYNPHMTLAYIDPEEDFPLEDIRISASVDKILIGHGKDSDESRENTFAIKKADDDKRLVFGWANVAIRKNGEQIKDWQKDVVDPEDLEETAYNYVLKFRDGGEEHIPSLRKKCRLVESVIFTEEKLKAMGIPLGTVPLGWWIGFYVDDDDAWEKVKSGHYKMFSIEGKGVRQVVDDD